MVEENIVKIKSNIISEIEYKNTALETLKTISNCLEKSLGPYGRNSIIQSPSFQPIITKDGFTILQHIRFEDNISKTIYEYIMHISRTLVRKVGDGTTSSVIIANSFANYLYNFINIHNNDIPMFELISNLEFISEELVKYIKKMSRSVYYNKDRDVLSDIATISANNNRKIGNQISEIYNKYGNNVFINLEKSDTNDSHFVNLNGFELNRGFINNLCVNQADGKTCLYDNTYIFMIDDTIYANDLGFLNNLINHVCIKNDAPLVIIAPSYDHVVRSYFHTNIVNFMNHNKRFKVIPIDISLKSVDEKTLFEDIALKTGGKIFKKDNGNYNLDDINVEDEAFLDEYLGNCKTFKATAYKSYIIEGNDLNNRKEIDNKIKFINEEINKLERNEITWELKDRIFYYKKRIAILTGNLITYYVGGISEDEKNTSYYLIEDAIYATRSAIHHGFIPGCNSAILNAIYRLKDDLEEKDLYEYEKYIELLEDVFLPSITYIYECLFNNKLEDKKDEIINKIMNNSLIYNLRTNEYENYESTEVINSSETDIEIIKNIISIITLIISCNQFLELKNFNIIMNDKDQLMQNLNK